MNRVYRSRGLAGALLVAWVATGLVGCDWESGSDAETISGRYGWVNFSGVYRGVSGGVLVTDYTTASADGGGATNSILGETVAAGDGAKTLFTGVLKRRPVIPGTLAISAAGFALVDNGNGGLAGNGRTGTIIYETGAWSVNLAPTALDAGTPIIASYQYGKTGGLGTSGVEAGSSGKAIYSFTVQQDGNVLSIVDNNGATYEGKISSIRTTGAASQDLPDSASAPAAGDTAIASYEASGTSAAGVHVKMVGTFQGVVGGSTETGITLGERIMLGTWIESGTGRTGDINGSASPITTAAGGGGDGGGAAP